MRLFLNGEPAVINGTTKAASFPFAVSRDMGLRLTHGFESQTTDLSMVSGDGTEHGH